jgi:hypothetical protein
MPSSSARAMAWSSTSAKVMAPPFRVLGFGHRRVWSLLCHICAGDALRQGTLPVNLPSVPRGVRNFQGHLEASRGMSDRAALTLSLLCAVLAVMMKYWL